MIHFGSDLMKSMFFGKNVIKKIFFGKKQIYPNVEPEPVTKFRINQDFCVHCGDCLGVCRFGAVSETDNVYTINPIKCVGCGECMEVCPSADAIEEYEA